MKLEGGFGPDECQSGPCNWNNAADKVCPGGVQTTTSRYRVYDTSACLRDGVKDEDCCAPFGQGDCKEGFTMDTNHDCGDDYTTCCCPVGKTCGVCARNVVFDARVESGLATGLLVAASSSP